MNTKYEFNDLFIPQRIIFFDNSITLKCLQHKKYYGFEYSDIFLLRYPLYHIQLLDILGCLWCLLLNKSMANSVFISSLSEP